MQNKKKLIGIISFVFAMVFVFMFMITINNVFIGHITFGDFYSRTTLSIVMLFLSSAIASFCFFNKIAKKVFHSNIPAALIGIFGLLAASVIDFYWGEIVINNIYNGDMAEIIKGAVVMLVSTLVGGFVTGFGIAMFDFSKKIPQEETVPTVEQASIGNTPISKTVSAILAFLFGL